MKILFIVLLVVHGLIHVMGFAKAFGLAELPQLTHPIARPLGLLWLAAAALLLATAVAVVAWPRWWWAVGAVALIVSQVVIVTSWSDARYGTVANAVLLVAVVLGFLAEGPLGFRAEFEREVRSRLAAVSGPRTLTDSDLASLPAPVQRYLRLSGAVGRPLVRNFRARFHGQFRAGPASRWMSFTAVQYNFYAEPARLFLMRASLLGIPVVALHEYTGRSATMRVKAASLVPVADARGPEMDVAETVTLFNDMCLFAPATLIDPGIRWREMDAKTVEATFTNAGHVVRAVLSFDDTGELANFVSDDRFMSEGGGKTLVRTRWSTPVSGYRAYGPVRLLAAGEARWHGPDGEWAYLRLTVDSIEHDVADLGAE